ncbi:MAG: M14 family zinc carboxypeptidase [Pseudomonadota bacterium]
MLRLFLALLLVGSTAMATEFWPGARYSDAIPTLESVVGHASGEQISTHAELRAWFDAAEAAAPDRVRIVPYATSWQGRELYYVIIASPENFARLTTIQDQIQRVASLADGAESLIDELPGTTWLSYAVHGNEISTGDSAMLAAYHLLAAIDDPVVETILEETIVFIDPVQNPDGRDRFIHQFESALGLEPIATRLAAERNEPWPGGRVNHYLFDLNRDWLPATQPETRGRIAVLLEWLPLAFVDAHEMGTDSTYFFAPEAVPYNPHLASDQKTNLEYFGRNNARWFDRFGIDYFTREIFDAFYPGYGASWPSYYGAVAMTYEQASARGLKARRIDGTELTYAETVRNHFVTSIATAETTARNRMRLWEDFLDYRRSAVAEGSREAVRAWAIPAQADQGGADRLAGLLARHGVEVYRLDEERRACGGSLAAGTWLVPVAQPAKRFVRVAMDPNVPMDEAFLARQEELREQDLPDEMYDVTAWSLPLMFNIETAACDRAPTTEGLARATAETGATGTVGGSGELAWLVPGEDSATARFMAMALRDGIILRVAEDAFTQEDRSWPAGTLVMTAADNDADVAAAIEAVAAKSGATVTAVSDSWVVEGPNFGSGRVVRLTAPKVGLAWDRPTNVYSPGAIRFVLEQKYGYPVVPIRMRTLAGSTPLDEFDVLILPDTWGDRAYARALGNGGTDKIAGWVERGGVLVTVGGGTTWAASEDVDLLSFRLEDQPGAEKEEDDAEPNRIPGTEIESPEAYAASIVPKREAPDSVSGVLVKAELDPEHWLSAGAASTLNVLIRGDRIFRPMRLDEGENVARFAGADELLVSGYLWEENRRQLAYKPFVVTEEIGRGLVIGFTHDPSVRAYLDGLEPLFVNAVLRAPAYTARLR